MKITANYDDIKNATKKKLNGKPYLSDSIRYNLGEATDRVKATAAHWRELPFIPTPHAVTAVAAVVTAIAVVKLKNSYEEELKAQNDFRFSQMDSIDEAIAAGYKFTHYPNVGILTHKHIPVDYDVDGNF